MIWVSKYLEENNNSILVTQYASTSKLINPQMGIYYICTKMQVYIYIIHIYLFNLKLEIKNTLKINGRISPMMLDVSKRDYLLFMKILNYNIAYDDK